MSTEPEGRPAKMQKTEAYKLYYWPSIPGRGEFIRLVFEYAGSSYTEHNDPASLMTTIGDATKTGGIPHFAVPALELPNGKFLSQTPAILNYLAPKLGLDGSKGLEGEEKEDAEEKELVRSWVNQLVLTALDLNNEVHDAHHPIASSLYYEEQKDAALERAKDFRATRLPKYLAHFQNVLESNKAGKGKYLVSESTTTADITLFHIITGLLYAFPKRMEKLRASDDYPLVFALHERVSNEKGIKEYLASERRLPFGMGVFRHYEELDAEE